MNASRTPRLNAALELRTEAGKAARHNVAFFDVTFSVQKSVTLLHTAFEAQEVAARSAGDEETAAAWAAFRRGGRGRDLGGQQRRPGLPGRARRLLPGRAPRRRRRAGYVDAHDWVVASFFQHDSRDHDPQLHIHNGVLNRVQGPDGVWRTLDGRGAVPVAAGRGGGRRSGPCEERLTHALGVLLATRPDGKAREIVGVAQEAMDLISLAAPEGHREGRGAGRGVRGPVRPRPEQRWSATGCRGRPPSPPGAAKSHDGRDPRAAARPGRRAAARRHRRRPGRRRARPRSRPRGARADAAGLVAAGGDRDRRWPTSSAARPRWTRADLTRAINAALPDYLGLPDGADVGRLLDALTDAGARRSPSRWTPPGPGDDAAARRAAAGQRRVGLPGPGRAAVLPPRSTCAANGVLLAAAAARPAPPRCRARPRSGSSTACAESGHRARRRPGRRRARRPHLRRAGRVAWSGRPGTGKSFVVGALAHAWTDPDPARRAEAGRVFGLATSQIATDVLAGEGLTARNITRWLATQDRLAAGPGSGRPQPIGDDEAWRLHAGDLVVVDESAMADTAALAAIHRHVDAAGAKLLLVGDHRQLAAVGAGGGDGLLAQAGARYELAEARRFTARLGTRGVAAAARRRRDRAGRLPPARPAARRRHRRAGRGLRGPRLAGRHPRRAHGRC